MADTSVFIDRTQPPYSCDRRGLSAIECNASRTQVGADETRVCVRDSICDKVALVDTVLSRHGTAEQFEKRRETPSPKDGM